MLLYRSVIHALRRKWYGLLYTNCFIHGSVKIGSNVVIRVTDGGKLVIGRDASIGRGSSIIVKGGELKIGESVFIGLYCMISANKSIDIGSDSLIAEGVSIRDHAHGTELNDIPFRLQQQKYEAIVIGTNVWVGAKSTILKGVSIGDNTVVGANAVVNRGLGSNLLAAGVPAKVLKDL